MAQLIATCPQQGRGVVIDRTEKQVLVRFDATYDKNGVKTGGPHEAWRSPNPKWLALTEDD